MNATHAVDLVGIDEAGRGSIAGPVAVGLVRMPASLDLLAIFPGLNDSKQLSEKNRERLFALLEETALALGITYTVVFKDAASIDARGIAVVIREAIAEGLADVAPVPSNLSENQEVFVELDGALRAPSTYAQETIVGGDGLRPAIMLASVTAKVTRDRYMVSLAKQHPGYALERHKGYGTAAHYTALKERGLCAIHRTSFIHLDRTRLQE